MRLMLFEWCVQTENDTLLRQWDTEKNGALTPHDVTYGSNRKPWWRCEKSHEWQAAVYTRTAGAGCPYCAGKRVWHDGNDFSSRYPEIAAEWHPTKNGALSSSDVTPGTHRKVWWKCSAGHEWQAEVKSRVSGCGCPVCANRVVLPGFNDLATTHPALAAQWHPTKNNGLTPADVVAGTERRVWWRCGKNDRHVWRAAVNSRTFESCGCPFCGGKKVFPGENDLAAQYPALAAEWDAVANAPLTPDRLMPQSNRRVHWICPLGHRYEARVSCRVSKDSGCPYCAGHRVLTGFNDLATREPKIAAQWYQPLNGALTPETVTSGSRKKVYWRCGEGHIWQAVISSRTGKQKCGCPVCAGRVKRSKLAYYDTITPIRAREALAATGDRAGS